MAVISYGWWMGKRREIVAGADARKEGNDGEKKQEREIDATRWRFILKCSKRSLYCLSMQRSTPQLVFAAWLHSRKFWWKLSRHR
jgi:hypothetical protein